MAVNNTPEGLGSEPSLGGIGGSSNAARGRTGVNVDTGEINKITSAIDNATRAVDRFTQKWSRMSSSMKVAFGAGAGGAGGTGASRISVPMAGSSNSPATQATGSLTGGLTGGPGGGGPGGGGPGGGGPGGGGPGTIRQYGSNLNTAVNVGIGTHAEYSLQADRMSVQLQQMYGMSNSQVRNQLRMPLTGHYLLGGGAAINDLLGLQASTGLTAGKQASTVEALRAVSGFSYGSGDITKMLSTLASPDVANRMFMMGGTGMYGIGGQERTGMQTIQDIIRRTGLTNPEALKGALQPGSNTRQRLTAMGVPQDMQDMVIQYAMQNSEFQKKTGGKGMYDPSLEAHRETMGIEDSYAVQHEKTTGERIKREESFYGRQTDNFAQFEKNLRSTTKVLAAFEDKLSSIVGGKISITGHPVVNFVKSLIPGGDPIDSFKGGDAVPTSAPKNTTSEETTLPAKTEAKLATLKPELSIPLRRMLEERPDITIEGTTRTTAQQESGFRQRYRPTNKTQKTHETDREWNGVIWEMKPEMLKNNIPAMAPPGQSMHELGLAADLTQDSQEKLNWVVKNAARFGLVTGYTGRGGSGDEPFHIEPQSLSQLKGGAYRGKVRPKGWNKSGATQTGVKGTTGTVSTASYGASRKSVNRTSISSRSGSSSGMSNNASSLVSYLTQQGNDLYEKINSSTPTVGSSSYGGDAIDGEMVSLGATSNGGGGISITVSPNIYLNGGQDMSTDIKRIAREVGQLLEGEVRLRMLRRT
jgi:hypothetical protein